MTNYKNIDERWGDYVKVTVDDYRIQASLFGVDAEIVEQDDGIYIDGKLVTKTI